MKSGLLIVPVAFVAILAVGAASMEPAAPTAAFPDPVKDEPLATTPGRESLVIAGGCFWGVQAVYQHVNGVISATSGYAGGSERTAHYEIVSSGSTGHAESVRVVYDPSRVSLGTLLKVFFSIAHDPTQLNRQGPDEGTQYRSAIFYEADAQQRLAASYIEQLQGAKIFDRRIVTEVTPLKGFYPAEAYHQDYATLHAFEPYIVINDRPKVERLRKTYPSLYVEKRAPTS